MDLSKSKIAVTGATGFIGRYIVRGLLQRGAHVIGVVRNPARVPALAKMGVELRKADLANVDELTIGFKGADAVISNAAAIALIGGQNNRKALIESNVQGTRNVFQAVIAAGVGRMVTTSSAVVYRTKADHYYSETDPLRTADDAWTPFNAYAVSKACAEQESWRIAAKHGIAHTAIRPHTVYGAFDQTSFMVWFKRLMSAPGVSVYPVFTYLPFVYGGDVAEAMCLALEKPVSSGKAYNIAGPPGEVSLWDFLDAWREAGGRVPTVLLPIPIPMRREYNIELARRDLGWKTRSLLEGCRELLEMERSA